MELQQKICKNQVSEDALNTLRTKVNCITKEKNLYDEKIRIADQVNTIKYLNLFVCLKFS